MPSLPWSRINDFLLQVCAARSLDQFNALVCAKVADLIPHDFPVLCVATNQTDMFRSAVEHQDESIGHGVIDAIAGEPGVVAGWNSYFRYHLPITNGYMLSNLVTDFKPYANTEFVTDFVRPRKIQRCLGGWFRRYTIVIPRCRPAHLFTDRETSISKIIAAHLENFYDALRLAASVSEKSGLKSVRMEVSSFGLTQREQEIALLLLERLTMPEIADRLFISPRTVEKHAENIYAKLGIRRKQELGGHLLGFHPYPTSE
ncbi:MAG: response regulator transcription factor [Spirochaetia bacterium]